MKISERIALIKAGYTKDEIAKLAEEDLQPVEETPAAESAQEVPEQYVTVLKALADEVKELKNAVQIKNINDTSIETKSASDEAFDILASLINPKAKKE